MFHKILLKQIQSGTKTLSRRNVKKKKDTYTFKFPLAPGMVGSEGQGLVSKIISVLEKLLLFPPERGTVPVQLF